jgi:hypothetical protein
MAKGGSGRMMSSSSGGIMGSGIFGMFGTVVQCKSDDTSYYCLLSKLVNIIIMVLFLLAILYFVYSFATGKMGGKMRGGSGSWFPSKFFS